MLFVLKVEIHILSRNTFHAHFCREILIYAFPRHILSKNVGSEAHSRVPTPWLWSLHYCFYGSSILSGREEAAPDGFLACPFTHNLPPGIKTHELKENNNVKAQLKVVWNLNIINNIYEDLRTGIHEHKKTRGPGAWGLGSPKWGQESRRKCGVVVSYQCSIGLSRLSIWPGLSWPPLATLPWSHSLY